MTGLPLGLFLAPLWDMGGRLLRVAGVVAGAAAVAGYLLGRRR